eukprot:m.1015502 g.1015502  ORF g.1015502 m.1015502 type:complete len:88 (+) comp24077_c0_seq14:2292-2555(+)
MYGIPIVLTHQNIGEQHSSRRYDKPSPITNTSIGVCIEVCNTRGTATCDKNTALVTRTLTATCDTALLNTILLTFSCCGQHTDNMPE